MSETGTLAEYGGSIKALAEDGDRLKIGGYAVLFGGPRTADLSPHRDYFTKSTDYGLDVSPRGRVRWQHGLDPAIGRSVLGLVDFKAELDDVGVWAEGWIRQASAYEKKVAEWVKAGRTGFSTGVPAHCVGRKAVGDAHEITEWCLGSDVSITLTPADPRQVGGVLALKSLIDPLPEIARGDEPRSDGEPSAVAAKSLVDRSERLVADLDELVPRWERAYKARATEGRDFSPKKLAALKALAARIDALTVAVRPRVDPEALAALHREADGLFAHELLASILKGN